MQNSVAALRGIPASDPPKTQMPEKTAAAANASRLNVTDRLTFVSMFMVLHSLLPIKATKERRSMLQQKVWMAGFEPANLSVPNGVLWPN